MAEQETIRCIVSGRVQGVWFRAGAQEQAQALGLDGHARNLPDGRVEVVAHGDAKALERLRRWLRHGTSNARVDELECDTVGTTPEPGFRIL